MSFHDSTATPFDDHFVFAEIGVSTPALESVDSAHTFHVGQPITDVAITAQVPVTLTLADFGRLFYGVADVDQTTGVAPPASGTTDDNREFRLIPSHIFKAGAADALKAYYNLWETGANGKYGWTDVASAVPGIHLEDKLIPVWMRDMGCIDEERLALGSLVQLKKNLHKAEVLNCGVYNIFGYSYGDMKAEYNKQSSDDFETVAAPPVPTAAATYANVALDLIISNATTNAKNVLVRISFRVGG